MHRFFVQPEECRGKIVVLGEKEGRHAARVLRLKPGDEVELLDGAGHRHEGRIASVERHTVSVEVLRSSSVPRPPHVILAPAMLKGRAMDFLVQKATELGATEIRPLITERTVVRVDPADVEKRMEDWRATAIEACKQCGNPWLPRMGGPLGLERFLASRPPGMLLVSALTGDPQLPGEVFRGRERPAEAVTIVTGPEGDLTAGELDQLVIAGAISITLGPLVLRGETAALASLAIVQHEIRVMSSLARG